MKTKFFINHSAAGDSVVATMRPDLLDNPTEITLENGPFDDQILEDYLDMIVDMQLGIENVSDSATK